MVEGAEIHRGDETALVNTDVRCCSYLVARTAFALKEREIEALEILFIRPQPERGFET